MLSFLCLALTMTFVCAETPFEQCPVGNHPVDDYQLDLGGCTVSPCQLKGGTSVQVVEQFEPTTDMHATTDYITLAIASNSPTTTAIKDCNYISVCPLVKDTVYTVEYSLAIPTTTGTGTMTFNRTDDHYVKSCAIVEVTIN